MFRESFAISEVEFNSDIKLMKSKTKLKASFR